MIKGKKVKYVPKDAYDTLTPINILLKMFSLTTLSRENSRLKVSYSWIKRIFTITALIMFTILVTVGKVLNYFGSYGENKTFNIRFTDSLQITYMLEFLQYIVDLKYVFKFGGYTSMKYFKLYEQIDDILGMMYNSIIKSKIYNATASTCSLVIVSSALDFAAWFIITGYDTHALYYSIDYIFFFINTLTIIDMCANVIQVEYRLKTIGDVLQDLYSVTKNSLSVVNVVGDKSWLYFSKDKAVTRKIISSSKFLEYNHLNDIVWLNKCYLLLIEQTAYINEIFGARILINNSYQLFNIVNLVNLTIRIFTGVIFSESSPDKLFLLTITCILRTICSAVNIAWLVYRCEQSYEQRATIVSIVDHMLVDKNMSESMTRTLTEFRNLVDSRPIQFTAMNFYPLDYGLVVSSASVVTTLTIIMLQSLQ
ncbi:hypothetical protein ABMA28_006535 [Loxostege sticticalis]|uniref:Gustatory receptor n=1 Tax=Loxostege sticticalis TaxID=481309 RepID=A0ABD0SLJ1_LOXSC